MSLTLYSYWRSSAAYRTRIALGLKGLTFETCAIDLRSGAQSEAAFKARNPQGLVPALETEGHVLAQSSAILEWLEEAHPEPALLPRNPFDRAEVRAMAALIACDIHPLNNLRVLKAIRGFGADEAAVEAWAQGWIQSGFEALERRIERVGGAWAFGDAPTLADCFVVPQVYSARRFNVNLAPFPRLTAVAATAEAHPAVQAAHPDRQPDAD